MATLSIQHGLGVIQFGPRADRKTIRLGKTNRRAAETVRSHIEHLYHHRNARHPLPASTMAWLADIGPSLHRSLSRAGLTLPRGTTLKLGPYFDQYIARRTDLKPSTLDNFRMTRRSLAAHFGAERDMTTITRGEILDWQRAAKETLSLSTVAMFVKKARQVFADAIDRRILTENPTAGIKPGRMVNAERQFYVPLEDILKAIKACPDAEWRLIFALARIAGMRIPSEPLALRWTDIQWDEGKMIVRSPKTGTRIVPIFAELLPYLRDVFETSDEGAEYVIARHRGQNLRTQAERIIEKAGLLRWPRLFQNLRSSCETDLTAKFPLHVVCAWIGNTAAVALRHYLIVTEAHFDAASASAGKGAGSSRPVGATETQHGDAETQAGAVESPSECPRWESAHPRETARKLKIIRAEMEKALARLLKALPKMRAADIAALQHEITISRRPSPTPEARR